jgi:hypothetical protein
MVNIIHYQGWIPRLYCQKMIALFVMMSFSGLVDFIWLSNKIEIACLPKEFLDCLEVYQRLQVHDTNTTCTVFGLPMVGKNDTHQ